MHHRTARRVLSLGGLSFALLHCAAGEEFDPGALSGGAGGTHQVSSTTGSSGGLAAGGAAGDFTSSGSSGEGGSPATDASSAGGQGGASGGAGSTPVDSGAGGGAPDVVTFDVAPCPSCALSVQYSLQKTGDMTNEIGFDLTVKNTSSNVVTINQISLRYWYTINGETDPQVGAVDYAPAGATMTFVKVTPARTGADYYCEMKFTGGGDLQMGQTTALNGRFHKGTNYNGNYDQTDDYSYGAGHTTLADWPKITAYVGGGATPVWGTEP